MVSTDGKWHTVSVSREGLTVQIRYDESYDDEFVITGSDLILTYYSNELYVAGRVGGANEDQVLEGYSGCIQDVRFNEVPLPSFGSNDIASVEFVGEDPREGCNVGICFPNPCGEAGDCIEIDEESYQCNCTNGEMVIQSSCDRIRGGDSLSPIIAILVSLGIFIIILIIAMVIGLAVVYKRVMKWNKMENAAARLNDISRPMSSNHDLEDYEIHENVYQYDCEDGEDDTSAIIQRSRESLLGTGTDGPSSLKTNKPTHFSTDETNIYSQLEKKKGSYSPKIKAKQSTQDVNAFIESRVNEANRNVLDVDSLNNYNDEGDLSEASSLSSICSNTGHEPYTITRLRLAGPDFERIAEFLEPVLVSADTVSETTSMTDDSSGIGGSEHTINLALMHNYD